MMAGNEFDPAANGRLTRRHLRPGGPRTHALARGLGTGASRVVAREAVLVVALGLAMVGARLLVEPD